MPSNDTKIALVTGGSSGIGRHAAIRIAERGAGVILTYNGSPDGAAETVATIAERGGTAVALPLDVGRSETFGAFAGQVAAELGERWGRGSLDHLVNNAGFGQMAMFADTTEELYDRFHRVILKGPFFLTQRLLPLLADGGAIVNLSTGLARFTSPQRSVYGAVKGAVEVLTRYQAVELGTRGIRVNAIAPGPVATDFSDGVVRDTPALQEHLTALTALGRIAVADDIGPAIAALLGDGNRWVTGQRIEVSGGIHL
jgi:NAD(P)-dependent dehydrogenase (short-subunit alcohol dehydrogenase family)